MNAGHEFDDARYKAFEADKRAKKRGKKANAERYAQLHKMPQLTVEQLLAAAYELGYSAAL